MAKKNPKSKAPPKDLLSAFDISVKSMRVSGPQTTLIAVKAPIAGTAVLPATAGAPIHVDVKRLGTTTVAEIWAIVHPVGAVPSPPLLRSGLVGYTQLMPTTGEIFGGNLPCPPGIVADSTTSLTNNAAVTAVAVLNDSAGTVSQDVATSEFKLSSFVTLAIIPATACLWFAFADDDAIGPYGEPMAQHRPVKIRIPRNAQSMGITAAGWWRWAANDAGGTDPAASGPEGRTASGTGTSRPEYKSEVYNSMSISQPTPFAGNSLIGLMRADGALTPQNIFKVGLSHSTTFAAGANRAIFLGHHDGYQWNTNSGEVVATITWGL
jgi:hypothetical protein